MLGRPEPDFSLSGLKTAVRLAAERVAPLTDTDVADLCASFQAAVVDVVVDRTRVGMRGSANAPATSRTALVVAGGVAANQALRRGLAAARGRSRHCSWSPRRRRCAPTTAR